MARCGSRFQKVSWVRVLQFSNLHSSLRTIIGSTEERSMSRMCRQSSADEQRQKGRVIQLTVGLQGPEPTSRRASGCRTQLRRHLHSRTGFPRLSESKRSGQAARGQACAGAPAVDLARRRKGVRLKRAFASNKRQSARFCHNMIIVVPRSDMASLHQICSWDWQTVPKAFCPVLWRSCCGQPTSKEDVRVFIMS